jgi:SAM-dependent methyltransferase
MQALSSVEGGYDLLAPKFDHTPFRTPDGVLDAAAGALRLLGPFGPGLDVCCGTGAGMRVLASVCQGRLTGVDFSAGMLAQARRAHPAAQWVRADVRAVPFTGAFDLAMRVRNVLWRPPFVMYYRTCPLSAVRDDLTVSGFTVTTVPLTALGRRADGRPRYRLVLARRPA